jgi:hypothetical protein
MKSVATFDILKSGQWPDFMKNEVKFGRFWRHWTDEKWSVRAENMLFWPPSAHFYFKCGRRQTVGITGFVGFVATFPLFL